jgi:aconitate hydratase
MAESSGNSFGAKSTLAVGGKDYELFRLDALQERFDVAKLPFSLKVLLENLLRNEGEGTVQARDVEALASWRPESEPSVEIAFSPARVLMQDFTGVPAVVDLAAMRDAIAKMGGDPKRINPLVPAELVIDHSVQVDAFGSPEAFGINARRELERNRERYAFLRWGQQAFDRFAVVPPDTGIVHQVNLEYLARVVFSQEGSDSAPARAYPDTLVGTDSHTTMVNGLGVLGWGVGGIEAEAAMLGQPMSMLIPQVLGLQLHGQLRPGATATDLVLTVTQQLRQRGVVGMFVEFFGEGLAGLPIADRATIGNMSPEFGSTCAIFPIDAETLRYLRFSGRPQERIELVEAYAREQWLWHGDGAPEPIFSDVVELDLGEVVPSLAGPKRPQDRIALTDAKGAFHEALEGYVDNRVGATDAHDEAVAESYPASDPPANGAPGHPGDQLPATAAAPAGNGAPAGGPPASGQAPAPAAARAGGGTATLARKAGASAAVELDGERFELKDGDVVIAAITSCTNTSNPSVMIGAGILARNAVARGLARKPWVKTSLAPGSKVVTEYLRRAGLMEPLERLGFDLVGYGCTTCIGNSGPLPEEISKAVAEHDLAVVSVLSGNRNFEGRINPDVKMNYLASPPLCVAYALTGTMDIDIAGEPLGVDPDGAEVRLSDIWPDEHEVAQTIEQAVRSDMFRKSYGEVFEGDEHWKALRVPTGERFAWEGDSTYVRRPPFFEAMPAEPEPVQDVEGARALALLGDSVTTDHISPAGSIKRESPAGRYLEQQGVSPRDFNSYGSRRGNHEVMMRGTFANIRLRNLLESPALLAHPTDSAHPTDPAHPSPLPEGGFTWHFGEGEPEQMPIYDAATRYASEGVPLVVIGGREYGSGSSRDWAAKGTRLLGVRTVIAQSFERIHRSNLVGMGVLPLQFQKGESASSLGLTGQETFSISGLAEAMAGGGSPPEQVRVSAGAIKFDARVRIDTPREADYFRHGGILQYVLRRLLA